jgi:hypothetical protein
VARLYRIPEARISDFAECDPALAIKFSILRERPSGSPGDSDIFGAQQYAPLLDIEVPIASNRWAARGEAGISYGRQFARGAAAEPDRTPRGRCCARRRRR